MTIQAQIKAQESNISELRLWLSLARSPETSLNVQAQLAHALVGVAALYKAKAEIDSLARKRLYKV